MNAHHEEWTGFSMKSVHGRAALDFALSSGCEQVATKPTRIVGGVLDLVLTDAHDLVGTRQMGPQIIVPFAYLLCWSSIYSPR